MQKRFRAGIGLLLLPFALQKQPELANFRNRSPKTPQRTSRTVWTSLPAVDTLSDGTECVLFAVLV